MHVPVGFVRTCRLPSISAAVAGSRSHGCSSCLHHSTAPRTTICRGAKQSGYIHWHPEHKLQGDLPCNTPSALQVVAAQQQQQQQHKHRHRSLPRPEQDTCRAISLRLKLADSTTATLDVITAHAAQYNEINTALAFAQLARHLRFETFEGSAAALSSSSYQQLQQLALQQISRFNSRQVNMILTSMAWMHGSSSSSSSRDKGDQIADLAHDRQQQQQWSQQPAAAVDMGQQQPPQDQITSDQSAAAAAVVEDLAAELAVRLQQLLDLSEPEDICHCLWSITKLQLLRHPDCSGLVIAATAHGLQCGWVHMLTGKPLSSLMWVHAQFHLQQQQQQQQSSQESTRSTNQQQQWQQLLPALVAAVMQECSLPGFLATWTPQEISMLLWSCAVLKIRIAPPAAAAAAVAAEGQQQQQQELLSLPLSVLKQVCILSTEQVVRFSPQGIANTCWALAQLLLPDHQQQQQQQQWQQLLPDEFRHSVQTLLDTFTTAAAAQLQFYKPQEVANILSACAKLQIKPKPLITSVSCYITNNSHHLNPRDVFELLVGFVQLKIAPEAAVTHALVYRLNQVKELLQPYDLVAAAWALVQLARPQRHTTAAAAAAAGSTAVDVGLECIAAVHQLLDIAAMQVASEWIADSAEAVDSAAAAAAVPGGNRWKQLLADPGGRPLVMLLRAAADSQYFSSNTNSSSSSSSDDNTLAAVAANGSSLHLTQQQQMTGPQGFSVWLLQQVQQLVSTCSVTSLLQLLITLTQIHVQHDQQQQQQQQQQLLLSICAAAEVRLLPVLPDLPAEQVVWAAWVVTKLRLAAAAAAAALAGDTKSIELGTAAAAIEMSTGAAAEARQFVTACLNSLQQQQQQQVAALPGHAIAAILHCCARVQSAPDRQLLLPLLAAAELRVLQMTGQQQLLLFWSLAELQHLQQQQQQQQQQHYQLSPQLVRLASDQMLKHVQLQLWQPPAAAAAAAAPVKKKQDTKHRRSTAAAAAAAAAAGVLRQHQQRQTWLHGSELQALAAACLKLLPLSQDSELLLAAVELWQEQQQQQQQQQLQQQLQLRSSGDLAMQVRAAMHMLCVVSNAAATVPALQLQLPAFIKDTMLLLQQYLKQQQQQQQGGSPEIGPEPAMLADLLVTAVDIMAKVRYQPSQQQLLLLTKQFPTIVSNLAGEQLVTVLHAFVKLGLPVPQQLLVAAAAAAGRALANPGKVQVISAIAAAGNGEEEDESDYQQQQQQQRRRQQHLPFRSRVMLLWCLLVSQYKQPSSSSNRLIMRLARSVLDSRVVKRQQQQLQLLQMLVQCRQLLVTQRYGAIHATLIGLLSDPRSYRSEIISPDLISSKLKILSKVCLHQDSTALGATKQQRLLKLLQSTPQTRMLLLQQLLAAEHVSGSSSSSNTEEDCTLQQQLTALMPLWIKQRLLQMSLQGVARELVSAGLAAAALKIRYLANGDVALLVSMQHSNATPKTTTINSSSSTPTSPSSSSDQVALQVLAIVLESSSNRAVNSGRLLGPSLCRNYLLQDWGCHVVSMPLECWLPDWVADSGTNTAAAAAIQQQRDPDEVAQQRKLMVQRILKETEPMQPYLQ